MKRWLKPLPVFLISFLAPLLVAVLSPAGSESRAIATILGASLLGFYLCIVIHELGHVVGGLWSGFRFVSFTAAPLRIRRAGDRLRAEIHDRWAPIGLAILVPEEPSRLAPRISRMLLGGPLANLLTSLVVVLGVAIAVMAGFGKAELRGLIQDPVGLALFGVMMQLGFTSLILGGANLLPMQSGGFTSDGGRLRMLRSGGAEAERWCAAWALLAASALGIRPRDWDAAVMESALALHDGSLDEGGACLMGFERALDLGDPGAARELLARGATSLEAIPMVAPVLKAQTAYFEARWGKDPVRARALLGEAVGGMMEPQTRLRAETAVLLAEGRVLEARATAARAIEALAASSPTEAGSNVAHAEWLRSVAGETSAPAIPRSQAEAVPLAGA